MSTQAPCPRGPSIYFQSFPPCLCSHHAIQIALPKATMVLFQIQWKMAHAYHTEHWTLRPSSSFLISPVQPLGHYSPFHSGTSLQLLLEPHMSFKAAVSDPPLAHGSFHLTTHSFLSFCHLPPQGWLLHQLWSRCLFPSFRWVQISASPSKTMHLKLSLMNKAGV